MESLTRSECKIEIYILPKDTTENCNALIKKKRLANKQTETSTDWRKRRAF